MTRDPIFNRGKRGKHLLPILPFGGHSGSMGSEASRERAESEDEQGMSEWRQREVVSALGTAGPMGLTWRELGGMLNWHHGQATGALSPLHGAGVIAALDATRDGCTVYVLPENVAGRPTREYGGGKNKARIEALEQRVRELNAEVAEMTRQRDATAGRLAEQTSLHGVARENLAEWRRIAGQRADANELLEQAVAAKDETINHLQRAVAALRIWRWALRLEPEEVDFSMRLEQAVTMTQHLDGTSTVPVTLDSMRMMSGLLRRLRQAQARISGAQAEPEQPTEGSEG